MCIARVGRARVTKQHGESELVLWVDTSLDGAATCCARFHQGVAAVRRESAEMDLRQPSPDTKESRRVKERESKESLSLSPALLFNGGAITLMGRSAPQIYRTQFVVATPACSSDATPYTHRSRRENKKQEDKHFMCTRVKPMSVLLLFFLLRSKIVTPKNSLKKSLSKTKIIWKETWIISSNFWCIF